MNNPLDYKTVTNMYLYGTTTTPKDKDKDSLIRPKDITTSLAFSQSDVMATVGRFAVGAQFEMVKRFFTDSSIKAGNYSKADLNTKYNLNSKLYFSLEQRSYADNTNDYAERTYIWNSMNFTINNDARFLVAANGTKSISNFSISAFGKVDDNGNPIFQDNFDFNSKEWSLNNIGNSLLQEWIDPSEIGRKVNLNFTGTMPTYTYTQAHYAADIAKISTWSNPLLFPTTYNAMVDIADKLFFQPEGITKFIDSSGRAIVYGSKENDQVIDPEDKLNDYLMPYYEQNGLTIITGDGNDVLQGAEQSTLLYGGTGGDIFSLANNSFIMDGTGEDRTFWGGIPVTGGVQQLWQEGDFAYYAGVAPLLSGGILGNLFASVLSLIDMPMTLALRYGMTTSGQLLIQQSRGRAGVAVAANDNHIVNTSYKIV